MYEVKKSSIALSILAVFLVSLPVSVMMLFIMVSDGLIRFVFRLFLLYIKNQIQILYYDVINPDQAKSCWSFNFIWFWMCKNTAFGCNSAEKNWIENPAQKKALGIHVNTVCNLGIITKPVVWYVNNVGDVVSKQEFAFPKLRTLDAGQLS